eukprot:gb/GFBE01035876.1/.p1 GENE.gb/GFBE01035876.1/~~gb/GFBE01035876.1/.p1  ORF type:complete len:559 (+),score=154.62 gb/GFBE01035876.1/:1-1677(+)
MTRSQPGSPKARTEEDLAQERRGDVQKFLDDWHYTLVNTKVAQTWGRHRIVASLLDALAMHGMPMPAEGKEALLKLEESDIVLYLTDSMPFDMRANFTALSEQLLMAVTKLAQIRQSLEAGDVEQVVAAFEDQDGNSMAADAVLRQTVDHASSEVARIRKCHATWRGTTEGRIHRLQSATEEADKATKALLVAQARIDSFRGQQNEKTIACLLGLVEGSAKATLAAYFAAWRGVSEEGKAELELRNQYEAQIENMQRQFLKYQESRLENVRNAMMRLAQENAQNSLSQIFKAWCVEVEQAKAAGNGVKQLEQMKQTLAKAQTDRSKCAMKVVSHMVSETTLGPLVMAWQGWMQFSSEYKKNSDVEKQLKDLELKLKEKMDKKKDHMVHVLNLMTDSQDEDLIVEIMQTWARHSQEEKRKRELDDAMKLAHHKLDMLKGRQLDVAHGVRGRMNKQLELICMSRHLIAWVIQTKVVRVQHHYSRKLDTKRKQLQGVQQLFQTFASQIEKNLDVEDDEDRGTYRSSRDSKRDRKSKGHHSHSGLQKGAPGTVSLPDIHQKH